ncbi:hypothetical protein CWI38_1482p0020 [Hamiltosporidium tvaerminnensis]|uniref:Uncharacterized protein n=1 Tax=Hamiltosporidium tvaerminnensis TaxID=1176355 RepID=A0A4Q9LQZ3_9MICR|nr:hypothetical protein CWI38_1482p0020 [Hamiltosporidium tvaerminnensis]
MGVRCEEVLVIIVCKRVLGVSNMCSKLEGVSSNSYSPIKGVNNILLDKRNARNTRVKRVLNH